MTRRLIAPILMISLGINLIFGFQNCGQVDPSFVFNEGTDKVEKVEANEVVIGTAPKQEIKPYLHISKVKVTKSDIVRLQRKVAYDFAVDFRVKYTTHYIGVEPVVTKPLEILDANKNTVAKIALDDVEILEKECIESIDKSQQTYFDCRYVMKVSTDLDVAVNSMKKQKYSVSNSKKGIEFEMMNRGKTIGKKAFTTAINYSDKFVPESKSSSKKMQAKLPEAKKVVKRKVAAVKGKAVALDTKPAKKIHLKKKVIEAEPKMVEGVYCHIKVLNPPHLEILSDVKKVGTYYEDADTCRDVAIKLSKTYCGHSLMGELDINWSIKDKRVEGEKVLEKDIESIECADVN
jgi:hypothetical protein